MISQFFGSKGIIYFDASFIGVANKIFAAEVFIDDIRVCFLYFQKVYLSS